MAVYAVQANPAGTAAQNSGYGSYPWQYNPSANFSVIPQGAGTAWMIWSCQIGGIPAGKTLNAIRVQGGNDFTVGGGGVSRTRQAFVNMQVQKTFTFTGGTGNLAQTLVGTGTGADMTWTVATPSYTTDDLLAGNVFIGVAVSTNSGDAGVGDGTFRYGAMAFYFYTDTDVGPPSGGSLTTTMSNPAANASPGQYPGTQFAAVSFTLNAPLPQASLSMQFGLHGTGLTFLNGTQVLSLSKGTSNDPGSPYTGVTGTINISPTTVPGTYTIDAGMGVPGVTGDGYKSSTLVVLPRPGQFTEF